MGAGRDGGRHRSIGTDRRTGCGQAGRASWRAAGYFTVVIDNVPEFENGLPATPADEAILDVIEAAVRAHVESHPEFTAMVSENDDYDQPPPTGTNHGETQGAELDIDP